MANEPDQITYCGFEPYVQNELTIGHEKIAHVHREIEPLHAEHYAETETLYLQDPFNPDYERLIESEERAQFVLFTVRVNWNLVGYLQYYVFRDIHTQGVYQAREDAFFLTKQFRKQGIAPLLLEYAEKSLAELGCKYVGMSSKAPVGGPDIGQFLESRGYNPVALFYSKKLEK